MRAQGAGHLYTGCSLPAEDALGLHTPCLDKAPLPKPQRAKPLALDPKPYSRRAVNLGPGPTKKLQSCCLRW